MNLIAYTRVSSNAQVSDGDGLATQRKIIKDYAKANGHKIVEWYEDAAFSGTLEVSLRPGLADAMKSLKPSITSSRRSYGLIVSSLDRLARDLVLQEIILRQLTKDGLTIISCRDQENEALDTDADPSRVLMRQILGAMSQYERALMRARTDAGKARKRQSGGYVGGGPPYGFQAFNKELIPNPEEQAVIEKIKRHSKDGKSLRETAELLHEEGLYSRNGKRWYPTTLSRILKRVS